MGEAVICCGNDQCIGCSYKRKQFTFAMILLAILIGILLIPFIVLIIVIPPRMQRTYSYKGADNQQARLYEYYGTFENYDGRVKAYWFYDDVLNSFPTVDKNVTHSFSFIIDALDYVVYPIWENPKVQSYYNEKYADERMKSYINYTCNSDNIFSVYLFSDSGLEYFTKQRRIVNCELYDEYVTYADRNFVYQHGYERQSLRPYYLVIYNPNPSSIVVSRTVSYNTTLYVINPDRAVMSCSSVCSYSWGYSNPPTMIVISDDYGEFTIRDGYDDSYIIITPLVTGMGEALVALVVLLIFWLCLMPCCNPPCCSSCFCDCCTNPCTKKKYNIPMIIMLLLTLITGVAFVASVSSNVYDYSWTCDDVQSVNSGELAICSEILDGRILFDPNEYPVTAYQYNTSVFMKLPLIRDTVNYRAISQILPPKFYQILFNVSLGEVSTVDLDSLYYSFSIGNSGPDELIIALINETDYTFSSTVRQIANYGTCPYGYGYCKIAGKYGGSMASASHFFNCSQHYRDFAVVAINPSEFYTITLIGEGYHTVARRSMDESRAIKVCYDKCVFRNPGDTKIVLEYNGQNPSVPVTLNETHRTSSEFESLICFMPVVFIAALVPTLVIFSMRMCAPDEDECHPGGHTGGNVEMKQAQPTGAETDYYAQGYDANPIPQQATI